jgi:hypothetical protein
VYARKVGEQTLTLGVSGNLWKDVLVLYDRETDSLWTQLSGDAIDGPLVGKSLQEIPSEMSTWAEWKARHPNTVVLKKSVPVGPGHVRYAADRDMLGIFGSKNRDDRLGGKEMIYGVRLPGGEALAVVQSHLEEKGGIVTSVGESSVLITRSSAGGVVAYGLPQGPAAVAPQQDGTWKLADGSSVDASTGDVVRGPRQGETLERLPVTRAYWFAWISFYPRSQVVGQSSAHQ